MAPAIYKKGWTWLRLGLPQHRGSCIAKVLVHHSQGFLSDGDDTFLVTLPDAAHAAHFVVQVRNVQPNVFRYTESRRIHNLQHGSGVYAQWRRGVGLLENFLHFFKP